MNLKEQLTQALEWYQQNYSITCVPESMKVEDQSNEIEVKFGSAEEDGYEVKMYVYNDGSLNRLFFTDMQGEFIETRNNAVFENFLYMNGAFNDFLRELMEELEDRYEKKYKAARGN